MRRSDERRRGVARVMFSALALLAAGIGEAASPGLEPEQARQALRVDPGLAVELVAAEPEITSPVAIAFDELGRLWVVEMRDYPNGPAPGKPPEGRIKILRDSDGDGRYDTASVFADGLLFANGLIPWKGGVVVTAAPQILYLADDDGDGRADRREALYEGFTAGNPQLRVSHPALGIDGWIYVANGLRGGAARRAGKPGAPTIDLSGRDFRFDLVHDRAEPVAGMGQFGNTFDDWGHRFVCTNRNHLVPLVFEDRYARRNPFLTAPPPHSDNQATGGAARIFPLSSNRTTSPLHAGTFSAACGVTVYRGALLPEVYRGAAFTCDPTGNIVHVERLEPIGAGFQGRRIREEAEFLASPDDRFRPVSLAHGPDGALYVVDMNRAVIEHPEWMPPEERNRPDLSVGKETGRIWRIVPAGKRVERPRVDLRASTPTALVGLLGHPDAWWRVTAQRLLLERDEAAAEAPLRDLARGNGDPRGRALAAWLSQGRGRLDDETILGLLGAAEPRLREQGVILAESRLSESEALRSRVMGMGGDSDARVRYQVALSLGAIDDDAIVATLARVALQGSDDRFTRVAVASAVPTRAGKLLAALLGGRPSIGEPFDAGRRALLGELAALVGARRDAEELSTVLDVLLGAASPRAQFAGLAGLAEGMGRRGARLSTFLAERSGLEARVAPVFQRAAERAGDAATPLEVRLEAIGLLGQGPWELASPVLEKILVEAPEQPLRLAAVRALAAQPRPEVAAILLAPWRAYTPAARREATEALAARPERVVALLDAIEAGKLAVREIEVATTRRLTGSSRPEIRDRARKLLADAVPEARKPVIERYRQALTLQGDAAAGREVFRKVCATCHQIAGIGTQVGPDISDTRVKTPEQLLRDVLDPNAAIDGNYVSYTVATRDGRVLTGLIAAESASGLTLRRAEGQQDSVLRTDIEELRSEGVSLMPEGLERDLDVARMADLIAFLKTWRDMPAPAGR